MIIHEEPSPNSVSSPISTAKDSRCYTVEDLMAMLLLSRPTVYRLLKQNEFRWFKVSGAYRISKASFEAWLLSQSTYQVQPQAEDVPEEPPLKLQSPKSGKYYSFQEIQDFYGISRTALVTWIREEGIPTIDVGRAKRVRKDVFDDVLKSKRKVEGDT